MPTPLSYPGVYIEEIPSGVRTIIGVATSITAFIGRALRGPVNEPIRVQSFGEYSRIFGGLWKDSTMSYAVNHFFQHGGTDALIVRVFNGDVQANTATITLATNTGNLVLDASGPGSWGGNLQATVDHKTKDETDLLLFNLKIEELDKPGGTAVLTENFRNVSVDPNNSRFVNTVVNEQSALVSVSASAPTDESPNDAAVPATQADMDGSVITDGEITGDQNTRTGLYALEAADLFNLLCIPPLSNSTEVNANTWKTAAKYCQDHRAVLIIDPPEDWASKANTTINDVATEVNNLRGTVGNDLAINAAVYFPRIRMADPLSEYLPTEFAPCGAIAGIIARTDAQRGVWKAPAGLEASFGGVSEFTYTMTDLQNGVLNPLGLNCLRSFPIAGKVVWGARTMAGADLLASDWKYLPVRRLALFLEESLYRGTKWVVFEPNDEPLWSQIRLNVGSFMHDQFRKGAFQGASPKDAYFVKCDSETTTQSDINSGIVNILVGFAPLKPAEFVVIKIQQMAGQIET